MQLFLSSLIYSTVPSIERGSEARFFIYNPEM